MEAFNEFVSATRKRKRAEKELIKYAALSKAAWLRMQELGESDLLNEMMDINRSRN